MKSIKTIVTFLAIFSSIFISSCEKEQDVSDKILTGKWNQISTLRIDYVDQVKQNEVNTSYQEGKMVLEIYEDGIAKRFIDGIIADSFYWMVDGDLFITTSDNGVIIKSQFSVSSDELNLKWAIESNSDGHIIRSEYNSVYKKAK